MALNVGEVELLTEKIEALANNPRIASELQDETLRCRLREASRKLSYTMEVPGDTVHRIINTPLQLALAQVGVETRLFEILCENDGRTVTNGELAEKTSIDPVLMKRLLRYYQSEGMISQPENDGYSSNNITEGMTSDAGRHGIRYFFDLVSPSFMAFPRFLRETGYVNPTDPNHCAWHLGHNTFLSPFAWLQNHPEQLINFLPWMASNRVGQLSFLDVMDFENELAQGTTESTVLFVDIGGALGHQCVALRKKYPKLPGRIILQDQAPVIEQVRKSPLPGFDGIETEPYDFFTPQPIKGARVYYLRNVLHDWPNHKCNEILHNVKASMTKESVLLIDEMVLSERGTPWRAAQLDMAMMAFLAATERTKPEWRTLLDECGFKVLRIFKYAEDCEYSVLVTVLK